MELPNEEDSTSILPPFVRQVSFRELPTTSSPTLISAVTIAMMCKPVVVTEPLKISPIKGVHELTDYIAMIFGFVVFL